MMPESGVHRGRVGPARTGGPYTRPRPSVHPPRTPVHPVHTSVPGIPGSAPAGVYTRPGPAPSVHTTAGQTHPAPDPEPAPVHTSPVAVHTLVWAARHLARTGPALVSGGVYTGPGSVVPPVVLAVMPARGVLVPAGGVVA